MLSKLLTALLLIPLTLTLAAESENVQNPTQVSTVSQASAHPISNVPTSNPASSAVSAILNSAGAATDTPTLITNALPPSATATNFSVTLQSTDSNGNVVSAASSSESVPSGYSASVSVPTGPVGGGSGSVVTGGTDAGSPSATATASSTGAAGRVAWEDSGVLVGAVGLLMAVL